MIDLLKIELKKLTGNKSFWVFSILFFLFLPVGAVLIPGVVKFEINMGVESYPLMPQTAESSWYFISWCSSWFSMFILAFIVINHISNEYAYRTVRQNVIDGLSRTEFLKGKLILIFTLSVVATIYVFLIGFFGTMYFESVPNVNTGIMDSVSSILGQDSGVKQFGGLFDGVVYVLAFFIQIVAYFIFAMFISFLVRKGALAIILYLVAFLAEVFIRVQMTNNGLEGIDEYFPLRSFSLILPNQGVEVIGTGMSAPNLFEIKNIILVLVYVVSFLFFTHQTFKKRDIN